MIFENTPQLARWLARDHPALAQQSTFDLNIAEFGRHLTQLRLQGDHPNEDELLAMAAFVCLTHASRPETTLQDAIVRMEARLVLMDQRWLKDQTDRAHWLFMLAVVLVVVLGVAFWIQFGGPPR